MARNEKGDPRDAEKKVDFLFKHTVPRRILGHDEGSKASFAAKLGIPRKTLEDQLERNVLPSATQIALNTKLGFEINWDEWATFTFPEFEDRYLKKYSHLFEGLPFSATADSQPAESVPPKQKEEVVQPDSLSNVDAQTSENVPPPRKAEPSRSAFASKANWACGGILAIIGMAVLFFWWPSSRSPGPEANATAGASSPSPNAAALPYISQARLFDESKSKIIEGSGANGEDPRHTLTALEGRSRNDFHITSAKKFFFALGFVLNHLSVQSNGIGMNVKLLVEGLPKEGRAPAWTEHGEYNYKDRWKDFDVAETLKPPAILQAFNLKEGEGFPIVVIIECRKWEQLANWSGGIRIAVQDLDVSKEEHQIFLQYEVDVDKSRLGRPRTANSTLIFSQCLYGRLSVSTR
jgi:hypothetical protein